MSRGLSKLSFFDFKESHLADFPTVVALGGP